MLPERLQRTAAGGAVKEVGGRERPTQAERRAAAESALLVAAADIIGESGVNALTLARVGERAGYSRGLVGHYFGSKRGLVEKLTREAQSGFVPALDAWPPGLERLLVRIEGYLEALGGSRHRWHAFVRLWTESTADPELAAIMRERDERFRADVRLDVAAGIRTGEINREEEPAVVAVAVVAQLRGIGLQWLLDPDAVDLGQVGRSVTAYWRRALSV